MLIPGMVLSYGLTNLNANENLMNVINFANIANFGFHSYVSTSAILSDYVKPANLSKVLRVSSFGIHTIAIFGLCKYFKKSS